MQKLIGVFLESRLSMLFLIASLLAGVAAVMVTPREEEPQIVVPMADVIVRVPGATAEEVEKLVTTPLERILWQVDGVEYVYSISRRDVSMVTVRFFVGEDREESLVKLHNSMNKNLDLVPGVVRDWAVKPVEIDDVPIVTVTLHSDRYGGHELRRIGEEVFHRLAEVEDVSRVTVTGGRPREVRVELLPDRLAAYNISPLQVQSALRAADRSVTAGSFVQQDRHIPVVSQSFLTSGPEVSGLVVGVFHDNDQVRPVYLSDIATILDGEEEPSTYSRIGFSQHYAEKLGLPDGTSREAVTLAIAKKKGTNAVAVSQAVHARLEALKQSVLPAGVEVEVTRDYGRTAQEKVDELLVSLGLAIVTVVLLLSWFLGWRSALVVALAVPVSFSLALLTNYLLGYTINRVTLFALILSLGLVVDDPITNVENIQRRMGLGEDPRTATKNGVSEVLPPVIMSTLAIIVSFTPLFFISGMMGPYMAPMAANVPLTVIFSTVCALTIVPWMAFRLLRRVKPRQENQGPTRVAQFYGRIIRPFLASTGRRRLLALGVVLLLLISCSLAVFRMVPLKMLPFDNKNELWIVLDLPEGTTLERTDRLVRDMEYFLGHQENVTSFVSYAGMASPMDFNGMVRHSYWRNGPNLADIRVNLTHKDDRDIQSHGLALAMRSGLETIAHRHGAVMQLVESPPGPPVIATLTAEVYGTEHTPYDAVLNAAQHVRSIMAEEPGITDLDVSTEAEHVMIDYVLDREKAALHGVSAGDAADTLALALMGAVPAHVHLPHERQPLPVRLTLPRTNRTGVERLGQVRIATASGKQIPLAELGRFETLVVDQPVYHKNLKRVAYVFAEAAGRAPAEAVLDIEARLDDAPMPQGTSVDFAGEGEWKITIEVFRDMGLAYVVALAGIFVLLVGQTGSFSMPLLIMAAIPLTLLGIMPGFWLLNLVAGGTIGGYGDPVFFTATSMIGMIALGGIVIRNSLVLIEFIEDARSQGSDIRDAIVQSGAVRMRPILLTAATTALGVWPITLDPIFSGLAWALIFGLVASTLFTLIVIPVGYFALVGDKSS